MSVTAFRRPENAEQLRRRLFNPANAVADHGINLKARPAPVVVELFHVAPQVIHAPEPPAETNILKPNRHDRWPGNTQRAFDGLFLASPLPGLTIKKIKQAVCQHYGIPVREIDSPIRLKQVTLVRHIAMYVARKLTKRSQPEIGREFGKRDHTTVLNAIRRIDRLRERDPQLNETIDYLLVRLAPFAD